MADDIVITGLGVVSPIGCGEQRFWEALCAGRSGAVVVEAFDTSQWPRRIACPITEPIDAGDETLGRASQLAVAAARQAVASSGLVPDGLGDRAATVIVGTTMGETVFIESRLGAPAGDWLSAGHLGEVARGSPGSIAENVRQALGLAAASSDLYGACAAGNMAVALARRSLLAGRCDVALVGGADGFSQLAFIGFMRLRAMAAEVCRPFDEQRDGLLVGEGSAMFVLEREADARQRGAPVRARVLGCGLSCEDYHPTRPEPTGDGLTRATIAALSEAGISPDEIGYVCAHGTGTPHNDAIEVQVMERCFPKGVSFSSIKALTGHTMGAAAAIEAACCVLTIEQQTLIPTWHLTNLLQPCRLDAVQTAPRAARVRCVLNNSAGFGGYNSSVVLAAA